MKSRRLATATLSATVLGALIMFTPSSPADANELRSSSAVAEDAGAARTITDFTDATPDLGWYVVNDGVMGGRSEGGYVRAGEAIDFTGATNTNGGGFSSIRTRALELDLSDHDGIRVRVRGDGRRYTWRLTTDLRWRGRQVSYWADFETKDGEWVEADIPFSRFKPQWRGRMLEGYELDPARIRGMGLMIYDKKDGPFALRLDCVRAYRDRAQFALAGLRGDARVLVVSAPAADDPRLRSVLEDVASTHDEFVDRDMVLVVLVDDEGSRADERSLSEREVRAARRAVDIDAEEFALRLVGKDGGVKRSDAGPTAMTEIYTQIDTMPMRRTEMRH